MYRLILQTTQASLNRPAVYQYLSDKGIPYETDKLKESVARYEKELNNYKKSTISLVQVVDVNLDPTFRECICDNCNCGNKSEEVFTDLEKISQTDIAINWTGLAPDASEVFAIKTTDGLTYMNAKVLDDYFNKGDQVNKYIEESNNTSKETTDIICVYENNIYKITSYKYDETFANEIDATINISSSNDFPVVDYVVTNIEKLEGYEYRDGKIYTITEKEIVEVPVEDLSALSKAY